jgi:HD-like signal output (HDOD) protein
MEQSTTDPLREKRVELILQQLEGIPALAAPAPQAVAALLESCRTPQPGPPLQRLGELAVGTCAAFANQNQKPAAESAGLAKFDREEYWKHAVAVGCCARLLAEQMVGTWGKDSEVDPFEAFVCGLLHDVGKLVLETVLPKSFARAVEAAELLRGNIADVERTVIGLDHMVAGKRLAEHWSLPANVRDCIWLHGQAPSALPATVARPRLVNLITLADVLVREQHIGYSGNYLYTLPRQTLLDEIGITAEQVDNVLVTLVEDVERVSSALGVGEVSSGALYQGALTQAKKEIDRTQHELQSKNEKLAIRAKFFEALAGFQGEMRPDAPPQTAMRAIGQTAIKVLDVTSA